MKGPINCDEILTMFKTNKEQAANDLERTLLRGELPSPGSIALAVKTLRREPKGGRYIDANELRERMEEWLPKKSGPLYDKCGNPSDENIVLSVLMEIGETPTADVAPVIHAKWEVASGWNGCTPDYIIACSNCGEPFYETDYCPHCGAKMDEEE